MIGIEYLCNLNNITYAELSRDLGISRQSIALWINGKRRIPPKHYEKLKEIFKVPEEYFKKELDELDKLQLQRIKLENDAITIKYIDTADDGTQFENTFTDLDFELASELDFQISKKKLFENIDKLLSYNQQNNSSSYEEDDEYDYLIKILKVFELVYDLIDKNRISINRLIDILNSVNVATGKRLESKRFILNLSKIIKEQIITDKLKLEQRKKMVEEYKKLEKDSENKEIEDLL